VFATLVVVLRNPDAAEDAANVAFTYRWRERLYKVGEVLRHLGRPRELSVNRVKNDRSFVNPDALRSR
jgi:hypothetical protein